MSKRDLDSSINDYIETETPKNYVRQQERDMAIGLQEVDNLRPSKYLEKLLHENVTGEKTIYEVECELKQYYIEKDKTDNSFLGFISLTKLMKKHKFSLELSKNFNLF